MLPLVTVVFHHSCLNINRILEICNCIAAFEDFDLAVASKAIVLGFNVKASGSVKSYAENKGVEIRLYRVIYELIDDVRNAMEGLLEPVEVST